jgi:hypothetical protein
MTFPSRRPVVSPDTVFSTSGLDATIQVAAGSYTLAIQVSTSVWGGFQQQDIPVCTQSSENLWGAHTQGGGSTNAVEHCPPPPGSGEQ